MRGMAKIPEPDSLDKPSAQTLPGSFSITLKATPSSQELLAFCECSVLELQLSAQGLCQRSLVENEGKMHVAFSSFILSVKL